MVTEGPRRSGRVRTLVKSYADEQAEEIDRGKAAKAESSKRKRETTPDEDEDVPSTKKPAKKTKKAAKSTHADETATTSAKTTEAKASSSKPPRTTSNRSWHGDAAESRIAATNRTIRKLAPGQEERRLRR